jgi:hypothetical protein
MTTALDIRWHHSADPVVQRITARADGREVQFYLLRLHDHSASASATVERAAPGSWRVSL